VVQVVAVPIVRLAVVVQAVKETMVAVLVGLVITAVVAVAVVLVPQVVRAVIKSAARAVQAQHHRIQVHLLLMRQVDKVEVITPYQQAHQVSAEKVEVPLMQGVEPMVQQIRAVAVVVQMLRIRLEVVQVVFQVVLAVKVL
jgi:hypothetical protein